MTEAFRRAIDAGRVTLGDKWANSYAKFDRQFGLTSISCSLCRVEIARLMPVGNQVIRRVKNQTFIQEGVMMGRLANYREVLMEMDDGSKHVSNLCVDCATKIATDSSLREALYSADLSQWSSEGNRLSDEICTRKPVSVLQTADFIRE